MPGEYISAGKQGSVRMGEVSLTSPLRPNKDLMAATSYSLDHRRAGTVSLNLSQSLDDPFIQQSSTYRNTQFLITTGPLTPLNAKPKYLGYPLLTPDLHVPCSNDFEL